MRRVLLDENLPRLLKRQLPGFKVCTVAEMGWAGTRNGALLQLAETEFDIFMTADRNLPHQQVLTARNLGVVVLVSRSTKLEDLRPLVPAILRILTTIKSGETGYISLP